MGEKVNRSVSKVERGIYNGTCPGYLKSGQGNESGI